MSTDLVVARVAVERVIEKILEGQTLKAAIAECGLTPYKYAQTINEVRGLALEVARAQELRADLLADETIQLSDSDEDPAKVRNQISARQWLASKIYAKRYGERVDLNVTQAIDITAVLAEARSRIAERVIDQITVDREPDKIGRAHV